MMKKERLVVIGNGMAGARFVEETVARGGAEMYDIVMFGEEPHGNYNRILLSSVLAGHHQPEDTFINGLSWYEEKGIKLYSGVKASWIDRMGQAVYAAGGISEPYDKLVIATGSTPYIPPIDNMYDEDGFLRPGVFSFRTLGGLPGDDRPRRVGPESGGGGRGAAGPGSGAGPAGTWAGSPRSPSGSLPDE